MPAILLALCLVCPHAGAADPADTCRASKTLEEFDRIKPYSDPDKKCKLNSKADCNRVLNKKDDERVSACENIYARMNVAMQDYREKVERHCRETNASMNACKAKASNATEYSVCVRDANIQVDNGEEALATALKASRERLRDYIDKSKASNAAIMQIKLVPVPITAKTPGGIDVFDKDRKCPGAVDGVSAAEVFGFDGEAGFPAVVAESQVAIFWGKQFTTVAEESEKAHLDTAKKFRENARKLDEVVRRAKSIDPAAPPVGKEKNRPSEVTGGAEEKKKEAAAAEKTAGGGEKGGGSGGGSGGGDKGGGNGSASGGQGVSSGIPPGGASGPGSGVAGSASAKDNAATKVGGGSSNTVDVDIAPPLVKNTLPTFKSTGESALSSSRSSDGSSSSGGRSLSSKAASAKASGGGGGAGGGGNSANTAACLGSKDCQQALGGLHGSQFSNTGSLGGSSMGGLDGFDAGATLDGLLTPTDPAKGLGGAGGSLDSLAALDQGMGLENGAGPAGEGGLQGAGIGRADLDIFSRVRGTHVRAQKRGSVAGIPKKL